jgi:hypothetical protein
MSMVERMHDGTVKLQPVTPSGRYDVRAMLRWASRFSLVATVLVSWEIISNHVIPRWDPSFGLLFPMRDRVLLGVISHDRLRMEESTAMFLQDIDLKNHRTLLVKSKSRGQAVLHRTFEGPQDYIHSASDPHPHSVGN